MHTQCLEQTDRAFPGVLRDRLGAAAPARLYAMGDPGLIAAQALGFVCSIQCPGSVILKTFEAMRSLRDAGVTVVGGFHSPMERECLDILLRGSQPVVACPARCLASLRLGPAARRALTEGRLAVVSPFPIEVRRTTAAQAVLRNDIVAALADDLFVPHAAPAGKTWAAVRAALDRQQAVWTFPVADNAALLRAGARDIAGRTQVRAG